MDFAAKFVRCRRVDSRVKGFLGRIKRKHKRVRITTKEKRRRILDFKERKSKCK